MKFKDEGFSEAEKRAFLMKNYTRRYRKHEFEYGQLDDGDIILRTTTYYFCKLFYSKYIPGFYSYRRKVTRVFKLKYIDGPRKGQEEQYVDIDRHFYNCQVHKNGSMTFYPVDEKGNDLQ